MDSPEQLCRDILEQAIRDDLVSPNEANEHPQSRTAGDLVGVANLLVDYLYECLNRRLEIKGLPPGEMNLEYEEDKMVLVFTPEVENAT